MSLHADNARKNPILRILFTLLSITIPIEIAAITLLIILSLVYSIYVVIMETIQKKGSESELFYSLIIVLALPIFLQVKGYFLPLILPAGNGVVELYFILVILIQIGRGIR